MSLEVKQSTQYFEKEPTVKEFWERNQKAIELLAENMETRLGEGVTSIVYYPESNERVCLKIFKSSKELLQVPFYLPVEREMKFLSELQDLGEAVKVPKPYLAADYEDDGGTKFFLMERVQGLNIKKILEGAGKLPEGFSVEDFRAKMKSFLSKIHEMNIYHRDLHDGNIMLTDKNEIYVIDFGSATKSFSEDAYEEHLGINNMLRFKPDEDNLRDICISLAKHMALTNKK